MTVATLWWPVIAIVSGSGMFCRPASVTKPALSECAKTRVQLRHHTPLLYHAFVDFLEDLAHAQPGTFRAVWGDPECPPAADPQLSCVRRTAAFAAPDVRSWVGSMPSS